MLNMFSSCHKEIKLEEDISSCYDLIGKSNQICRRLDLNNLSPDQFKFLDKMF